MGVPARPRIQFERQCLLILIAIIVAYSLTPFDFSAWWELSRDRTECGREILGPGGVLKSAGHFLSFFVLGVFIAAVWDRRLRRVKPLYAAMAAGLVCVSLELAQLVEAERHARVTDLIVNSVGLVVGSKAGMRGQPLRRVGWAVRQHLMKAPIFFQLSVILLGAAGWWYGGFAPSFGALRMGWNDDYRLVLGSEVDGTRPWRGEIRYVGIYGTALASDEVKSLADSLGEGRTGEHFDRMKLLAGYALHGGSTCRLRPSGLVAGEDLEIEIPARAEGNEPASGTVVGEGDLLISQGTGAKLTAAIVSSGAFSVEAWIRPSTLGQVGPARIVSLSSGAWERNFTLAQQGDGVVFRVRNKTNGANGTEYELHAKSVLRGTLQHLVVVYDHGVSAAFLDGNLLSPVVDLREPPPHIGLGAGIGGSIAGAGMAAVVFGLPIYTICAAFYRRRLSHLAAVFGTVCLGILPYLGTILLVGGPWRFRLIAWFAAVSTVAYCGCVSFAAQRSGENTC